jgi:anti-sigma factor ChrR (cupin superfamily)
MITEQEQEQAALCALGLLPEEEQAQFLLQVRARPELRDFLRSLQRTTDRVALAGRTAVLPGGLKEKVLRRIEETRAAETASPAAQIAAEVPGLRFLARDDAAGWKQLPIAGAWIKLLSLEPRRGYAVLLGKLEPGVRYPAHTNAGPEDFYILTGDLHVGNRVLGPGDFHHAEAGSVHTENYSAGGCTLLSVLTTDDPLVSFAMS